ncbi:hypothetical protein JTE90_019494 [Oedothorax gibbosus]|uniref:Uncharacterized protein n=1 Tax=Oedothorax gibbosus TaxID=931172 RepID=A0AAV6UKU5_9ARAC|nr:hypothetical protein JTE90_019494 [Oedothorax gibbosus]
MLHKINSNSPNNNKTINPMPVPDQTPFFTTQAGPRKIYHQAHQLFPSGNNPLNFHQQKGGGGVVILRGHSQHVTVSLPASCCKNKRGGKQQYQKEVNSSTSQREWLFCQSPLLV